MNRMSLWVLATLVLLVIIAAAAPRPDSSTSTISKLDYLDTYIVSNDLKIEGTQVGGLSGIDFDVATGSYYIISDDRSALQPARYYQARITLTGNEIDTVVFTQKTDLVGTDGKPYPAMKVNPKGTIDPEGIRINPKTHELVWLSEGERIIRATDTLLVDPGIFISDKGTYTGSYPIDTGLMMRATEAGPRQNGTFEGLTYSDNFASLLVSLEEPLYQDGPRADVDDSKSLIRIYKYDVATRKNTAQFAYDLDPVAHAPILPSAFRVNGVPDILDAGNNQLLVVERSFSTGRLPCTVKIFLADLNTGTNVLEKASLKNDATVVPITKKLLLNMDDLKQYVDNVEGITWGPVLANGHRTIIAVTDNNFQTFQKTQFFLFEVTEF